MRVLILADVCNPEWPSLPIVAYKAICAIAERADVVVFTHIRNRPNIEKVGFGRATVRYIDNEFVARRLAKLDGWLRRGKANALTLSTALGYPGQIAFEWEVWKAARDELRRGEFDIVHRLTPMSPTLPSPMVTWSPVPFILGPLNGGLKWPPMFRDEQAREGEWLSYLRGVYRVLPYYRSTYRNARAVLAAFNHTIDDLPKQVRAAAINFPELGIDPNVFHPVSRPPSVSDRKKTILFAGRFVPCKLSELLVRIFAERPALQSHRLVMVGDGPERSAVERLCHSHNLRGQIEFLGWKPQSEVAALMREADIFAFPSIRELGGGVVLEAMACGLACVVVDYGGPGALIDADRGIKVPLGTKDQLARDFGDALVSLVTDEARIINLGSAAREHAMQFYSWDAKARKTIAVYEWALDRGRRPNFWED